MNVFLCWCVLFSLFAVLGILCFFLRKPVGFWANAQTFPVTDVKGYNRACGLLWIGFSVLGILTGLPLRNPENTAFILLSVLGAFADTLVLMLIYILVIEKKYRKK